MSVERKDKSRTKRELIAENEELRTRLDEAEQTLAAIRGGEVDALVVSGPEGERIYSLTGAERTYRLIVETMNEAALTVGFDMTILFCNPRFCDLVKCPMAETIGRKLTAFVAPAQEQPLRTLLGDARSGSIQRRLILRATDGAAVSVQFAASLLSVDGGASVILVASDLTELEARASSIRILREKQQALEENREALRAANASLLDSRRATLNVAEDAIAARRQAEKTSAELRLEVAERKKVEQELQRSRKLLRAIIDNSPFLIYLIDRENRFLVANKAMAAMLGMSTREIVGRTMHELMPEETAARHEENIRKVMASGSPLEFEESGLFERNPRTFLTITFPIRDADDDIYAIAGISTDITEHKQAEEELKRSNEELEQFAYVASHDLQAPLRSIAGFLHLLQKKYDDAVDEEGRHFIKRSVSAAGRMQSMITDLLTLSSVTRKDATCSSTDLNCLIRDVLENLQSTLQEKKADITCEPLPRLTVNGSQIRSLFQNLISNALKYNKSVNPAIEIGCREHDRHYRFYVKDNGIGIAPKFREKIFLVFQRLHTEQEYPGTGLGLALCKKIVERHGGRIWVDSQPEEGSTFYFELPRE